MKAVLITLSLSTLFALPSHSQDTRHLDSSRRIILYSKCYYESEKAWFFQKGSDGAMERVTIPNLRSAMADNSASLSELKIARTNIHIGIGLLAAGAGTVIAGVLITHQRNTDAYNTYKQQSATWYASGNPNSPMPTLPHYGLSPLFYVGSAIMLSGFIPIFNVRKHVVRALDIYNGNE